MAGGRAVARGRAGGPAWRSQCWPAVAPPHAFELVALQAVAVLPVVDLVALPPVVELVAWPAWSGGAPGRTAGLTGGRVGGLACCRAAAPGAGRRSVLVELQRPAEVLAGGRGAARGRAADRGRWSSCAPAAAGSPFPSLSPATRSRRWTKTRQCSIERRPGQPGRALSPRPACTWSTGICARCPLSGQERSVSASSP